MVLTPGTGWPSWQTQTVERWRDGERTVLQDPVAEEVPVVLVYNGEPHVVMLATPSDLEDFAIGFSLTEGIVEASSQILSVRVHHRAKGIEVRVRIPDGCGDLALSRSRNLTGRTGCGLCGARSLEAAVRTPPTIRAQGGISQHRLSEALRALSALQNINTLTGAVHAAGWFSFSKDEAPTVREDVGRHNALDKLIGALSARQVPLAEGFVVVTSRASYEMVQKCGVAGIGLMAAMSAPTGRAIRLAETVGLTLIGFAREHGHVVYTHPQRLSHEDA